jgi:hypothetical protein
MLMKGKGEMFSQLTLTIIFATLTDNLPMQ